MKSILYVVPFVISCSAVLADNNAGFYDDNFTQGYVDNPDNYEEIVRPCQVYDLNCIRRFFADHSKCMIRNGPIPESLLLSQTIFLGRINTSLVLTETMITGLNSTRVEEFYYNKATKKIVFAIEIFNYGRVSPNLYFVVYRRGREPVVARTSSTFLLDSVTATSVIPFDDGYINLEEAEVTAYFDSPAPIFTFGPELLSNPDADPVIAQAFAAQASDLRTDTQEDFLTTILPLPIFYIQTNICDFGLKLPQTS